MKTYLSIEVGEQKIRYLLAEEGRKGLVLKGAGESTLRVGPSAPGALAAFVKELTASRSVKINRLFLTINRRDTMVHQLNLGQVSKADLEMIIPAEIEKIPSFFDSEFDYVYHQHEFKTRNKVIFGAMKDDLLQYLLEEIRKAGIPCHEIEMAPLNLPGLLRSQEFKDDAQTLIVLGEHLTHLVVFEDKQIRYFYSTTIGEEILGNPPAIRNWGDELKRALKSYDLETKQTANKIWLVWDREKAPDFDDFLRRELNFNAQPLSVGQQWFTQDINPVLMLAATPIIYYVHKIKPLFSLNHFLRSSKVSVHARRTALVAGMLIFFTAVVLGFMISRSYQAEHQAWGETKATQQKIVQVQQQSADIIAEHDAYLSMRRQLLFQATYVQLLKNISWSEALSVVASELPHELALTSFKVDEAGQVTVAGEAFRMESIAKLLRTIETSSILERGQFSYLTQEEVEKKKIFRFGILASLKGGEQS